MEGVTNCAESSTVGLRQVRVRGITFAPDVWMKCDVQSWGPDSCAVVKDREEEEVCLSRRPAICLWWI